VADRIAYKKLPGHRRGFFRGSSVWLGPDHLLLVKSMRFREEYKRFYFRDIQGIVIARKPRFHISTRSAWLGSLWLIALAMFYRASNGQPVIWSIAAVLILAWIYISAAASCTCRIFTAVSRDDLPSVYRTWVARRFLRAVEPRIQAAQAAWESVPAEALEEQQLGPREAPSPEAAAVETPAPTTGVVKADPDRGLSPHAVSFYCLLAGLLADAATQALTLYRNVVFAPKFASAMALLVVAGAVLVLVQYRRRKVRRGQQRLAIAALVSMGLLYYVRFVALGALAGARAAATKQAVSVDYMAGGPLAGQIEMGVTLLLGLAGIALLFAGRMEKSEPPRFTV